MPFFGLSKRLFDHIDREYRYKNIKDPQDQISPPILYDLTIMIGKFGLVSLNNRKMGRKDLPN